MTEVSLVDLEWYRLDDGVMGGRSATNMDDLSSRIHFHGTINTNGGGFASIRAKIESLSGLGIRLRYKGDGKTYKLILSDGTRNMESPTWQTDIPTKAVWEERTFLFKDFKPAFGGGPRRQPKDKSIYKFDVADMKDIGFMLSLKLSNGEPNPVETFGEGIFPFSLQVDKIQML